MEWIFLAVAIALEVGAVTSLRLATNGSPHWYVAVVVGYLGAFVLLSLALGEGLGLGVAYGIWAATGVALTALVSKVLFKEPLTLLMSSGIALIIGGVLLVELGGAH